MEQKGKTKIKYQLVIECEIDVETTLPLLTQKALKHELGKLPIEKHISDAYISRYDFIFIDKVKQDETWQRGE